MNSLEAGLSRKCKVGVVVSYNEAYADMARVSVFENIAHYCNLYGYTLHVNTQQSPAMTRHPAWNKVIACIEALPLYDWIFYIDVDCIVMNHTIQLEVLIDDDYSFIVPAHNLNAVDTPVLNEMGTNCVITSQFLVRNDDVGMAILQDIWDAKDWPEGMNINSFDYEGRQARITIDKPQFRERVKVIEEHLLNRFWYVKDPFIVFYNKGVNDNVWQPGDFIVHVSNYPVAERVDLLDMLNYFSGGDICGFLREPFMIKFTCFVDQENIHIQVCNVNHQPLIAYFFPELSWKIRYILYTNEDIDNQDVIVKIYRHENLIGIRYLCKQS